MPTRERVQTAARKLINQAIEQTKLQLRTEWERANTPDDQALESRRKWMVLKALERSLTNIIQESTNHEQGKIHRANARSGRGARG